MKKIIDTDFALEMFLEDKKVIKNFSQERRDEQLKQISLGRITRKL